MKTSAFFSRTNLKYRLPFIVLALFVLSAVSACSGSTSAASSQELKMAPVSQLPAQVKSLSVTVKEAYQFAVANPDILQQVPCYCGCGSVGHTSNYSCYVQQVKPSGEVVYDFHGAGCSICVDITQDVMKMTGQGKSAQEIRTAIDETFSQYGPSNMPPAQ